MKLSKKDREQLRMKFGGRCAYCGVELPETGWHADHVEPVNRELKFVRVPGPHGYDRTVMRPTGRLYNPERDRHDNLMPACRSCNIDKSSCGLEQWRRRIEDLAANLQRNSSTFRHAVRFGRVTPATGPVVFWFERSEFDCCAVKGVA